MNGGACLRQKRRLQLEEIWTAMFRGIRKKHLIVFSNHSDFSIKNNLRAQRSLRKTTLTDFGKIKGPNTSDFLEKI